MMTDKTITAKNEKHVFTSEISDEVLERAAGNEKAWHYTLAACTGLSVCPG